jgi:2,3-bisphosphoglycerate-independent phosphoglycerate mutase
MDIIDPRAPLGHDLIAQAKKEIWDEAMQSAEAIKDKQEVVACYIVYAHSSSMVALDPSMPDDVKLGNVKTAAYAFLRGLLSVSGMDVSKLSDESILRTYARSLGVELPEVSQ